MKIKILGGSEIGGSATLLQLNGINLLVDCGMIMNGSDREEGSVKFPQIPRGTRIDFLLITHAHLDHSGGLVEILKTHPECTIMATKPTFVFAEMLLRDVYKTRQPSELIPEDRIWVVRQTMPYEISPGVKVIFWPSGHIRGSASIIIEAEGKKLMFSGDISHEDLPTVSGFNISRFSDLNPDILFLESTYGKTELPLREYEEKRLCNAVKNIIRRGGNVLIPAFALGRAQDVAVALARNGIRVFLDGMAIYMAEQMMRRENLWGNDKLLSNHHLINFVFDDRTRSELLWRRGIAVVASSGWCVGGKVMFYLERWLSNPANAVFFPGPFQKNTAAKLLDSNTEEIEIEDPAENRREGRRRKRLGLRPTMITVLKKAKVEKFLISSHSGQSGLVDFARGLSPKKIILTHGEQESKKALSAKIIEELRIPIEIGFDGMEIEIKGG